MNCVSSLNLTGATVLLKAHRHHKIKIGMDNSTSKRGLCSLAIYPKQGWAMDLQMELVPTQVSSVMACYVRQRHPGVGAKQRLARTGRVAQNIQAPDDGA